MEIGTRLLDRAVSILRSRFDRRQQFFTLRRR